MTDYFHKILNKYNEELEQYSCEVNTIGVTTEREVKAHDMIPKLRDELDVMCGGQMFIFIEMLDEKFEKKKWVSFNYISVEYKHEGYASGLRLYIQNTLTKKWVDISINAKIIGKASEKLTLIDCLKMLQKKC